MPRHHLIISGTGRAGTTFLVQLFTQLGLDTGFSDTNSAVFPNCRAGMETDIRRPDAPYIVKSPFLCDDLDDVVSRDDIVIDHAILPVRDLFSAAESRRHITDTTDPSGFAPGQIPGGLWHTENPAEQENVLARQFYKIAYTITRHNIPLTLLHFPRFVFEPEYLYRKLPPVLGAIEPDRFLEAFCAVSRPELVHDFRADSTADRTPLHGATSGARRSRVDPPIGSKPPVLTRLARRYRSVAASLRNRGA